MTTSGAASYDKIIIHMTFLLQWNNVRTSCHPDDSSASALKYPKEKILLAKNFLLDLAAW